MIRSLPASLALLALGACSRAASNMSTMSSSSSSLSGYSAEVQAGVARVRAATDRFHSLDSAVAAGYPRDVAQCYANGAEGAMGYHHVNRSYVDAQLDLDHPEILIYERLPDARYDLIAVEFIIPFTRWPADSTAPVLLGQRLKPYSDLRIWSTHMWVWKDNPSGLFADWNPRVHCLGPSAGLAH